MQIASRIAPLVVLLLACTGPSMAAPPDGGAGSEWRHWGGTPAGVRFSPLRQIHRENVARLVPAWTYRTGELALGLAHSSFRAAFSTTPLVVGNVVYLSTPSSRVIALEPDTGREVWTFDPQAGKPVREFNAHRGVAYWEAQAPAAGQACERRILAGTVDGRLFALDPTTGRPCADFGKAGFVDLREELQGRWPQDPSNGTIRITSPPVVYRDLVITGYAQQESPGTGPYGDVRAYDVRTGREAWRFHTVPRPGEFGHDTWEGESWKDRMGVNVWSMMSVDLERGIVFLPLGSPTADFYGGDRQGMNLFGNSLVALDGATGRRLWHFQMVHHDLWDYDLPAQPVLFTFRASDGREVPAVAQVTKMGFVYVLDRVTGQPLFPVEERPVPASEVPGEAAWPTQPFPTKPPPLSRVGLTREDLSRVTPESADVCRALFDRSAGGSIFTPTGLKPTIFFPGLHGGGDWGGGALDPETGLFYVAANEDGAVAEMRATAAGAPLPYRWQPRGEDLWFRDANGWPCQAPPWGTLNAVDLSRGEIAWRVPLGVVDELLARGVPKTGVQSLGGAIVTAGGIVFIGATVDRRFRAFDAKTGEELWSYRLPANAHANPITFAGRDGRQYIVIAAGGGGFSRDLSRTVSDTVIAFALPR